MSTLDAYARFLAARWDEAERIAQAATLGPWQSDGCDVLQAVSAAQVADCFEPDRPDATHIALHDPAYVLDDLAAKRAVLKLHKPADGLCASCGDARWATAQVDSPCPTVKALAAPFRDHPDHPANQEA